MRTEKEIQLMIDLIEECYPENEDEPIGFNPVRAYQLGILAGLKAATGEYPSFMEMDMTDFMRSNFRSILIPHNLTI